jgi:hypothetical protein
MTDLVMQVAVNYFFDPSVKTVSDAFYNVNLFQVLRSAGESLISFPGGPLGKAFATAAADVAVNWLDAYARGEDYNMEQAMFDFATGFVSSLAGDALGELISKYGDDVVQKGLQRIEEMTGINVSGMLECPSHSFEATTLVSTSKGLVPIEDIVIGDYVLAYDETSGEVGYYPVTQLWEHVDTTIVTVTINGEEVETTPWHPFYTDLGWQEAEDLTIGSRVLTAAGSYGVVEVLEVEPRPQVMYDLTVDVVHTYFVGEGQWLVHNCGGNPAWITPGSLPADEETALLATLNHIDNGTVPTDATSVRWGISFRNDKGDLPGVAGQGGYQEYRVASGAAGNVRRIVVSTNQNGPKRYYYTWTHYGTAGTGNPPFVQFR